MEETKKLRGISAVLRITPSLRGILGIGLLSLGAVSFAAGAAESAPSSTFPVKPIRLVVPTTAGGNVDAVARSVSSRMSQLLGKQIVVDNREGAGGVIGTATVARALPDGYTLLAVGQNFITAASMSKNLPFDAVKDFAFISDCAETGQVLVINPSLTAKNLKDFISLSKTWPGGLNYASSGAGTNSHLSAELFNTMTGAKMVHVAYKGGSPAFVAVMSGEVQALFTSHELAVSAGEKLRKIAQGGRARSPALPDVPTFVESGLRDLIIVNNIGLAAPAGTPRPVINRLHGAIVEAITDADIKKRFTVSGTQMTSSTPQEYEKFIKSEITKWTKVARDARIIN